MISSRIISTVADLDTLAIELKANVKGRDLWLLNGPMGSGKTTLSGKIVNAFGGTSASSPTYAIHQEYPAPNLIIDHLDLYRLNSIQEFEATGLTDLFLKSHGLILIEWAERLSLKGLSKGWSVLEIKLDFCVRQNPDDSRQVRVRQPQTF